MTKKERLLFVGLAMLNSGTAAVLLNMDGAVWHFAGGFVGMVALIGGMIGVRGDA